MLHWASSLNLNSPYSVYDHNCSNYSTKQSISTSIHGDKSGKKYLIPWQKLRNGAGRSLYACKVKNKNTDIYNKVVFFHILQTHVAYLG